MLSSAEHVAVWKSMSDDQKKEMIQATADGLYENTTLSWLVRWMGREAGEVELCNYVFDTYPDHFSEDVINAYKSQQKRAH